MIKSVSKALSFLLLAPAVLPLVYFGGLLYPHTTPKTLILRGLGVVLTAAILFLILSRKEMYWGRLREKQVWVPGALLFFTFATSLFGVDFYHSFWSIFERGDGILTLTVVVLYFYTTLLVAREDFLERLCKVVAWTASLVALYTILQWMQGESGWNIPIIAEPQGRYGGTLGNAAFLAAYLGVTFFVTLIAAPLYRGRMRPILFGGAALQVLAIFISATRGTILAIIAAAGISALYVSVRGEGKIRMYARITVVTGLVALGLFFGFREQLMQSPIEPLQRLASISLTEGTVESRLFVWRHMLEEAKKAPLRGVGAEHIDILFDRFYDPTGIEEEWFDRSHNAYLDYLVQYGVVGLVLYLAIVAMLCVRALRFMREDEWNGGLLVLLVLVYALQNFFVFDTAPLLWLLLMLFALALLVRSEVKETLLRVPRVPWMPEVVGILILILLIPVVLQPLRANIALAEGYTYHVADVRRSVRALEYGLSLGTYADLEYGYQTYEMYTERQSKLQGEERLIAYRFTEKVLGANYERYFYDGRTALYYAHVLDVAPPEVVRDEEKLRRVIDRSIALSPRHLQSWYLLANISLRKGDQLPVGSTERAAFYREGIDVLARFAQMVPLLAEPRYVIATLYLDIGEHTLAAQWADEARTIYRPDFNTARRAARYYISIEDWTNATRFMRDVVALKEGTTDYPALYDLAKVSWLAGEREEAREIIERIKVEAPGLFESDQNFMQEYNATP